DQVREVLRRHFRPEFLNRVDETVLFRPLRLEQLMAIIDLLVAGLRERLADRKIGLTLTDSAKAFIAQSAYDPHFGARPLHRYLQARLETPLAKLLIGGRLEDGQQVTVDEKDGELVFV
ncbi:MAG: type VI secretion system ATPase TssH, partial [Pseudodesulfovibrio sp.]